MPVPSYIGDTDWNIIDEIPAPDGTGPDTLTIVLQGPRSTAHAELASYTVNVTTGAALGEGYPDMILRRKILRDQGSYPRLELQFNGLLEANSSPTDPIDVQIRTAELSGSAPTTAGESVQFRYLGTSTTYRWMSRTATRPSRGRFPLNVPNVVTTDKIWNVHPANYSGRIRLKSVARMVQFDLFQITSKGPWVVVEGWNHQLESSVTPEVEAS